MASKKKSEEAVPVDSGTGVPPVNDGQAAESTAGHVPPRRDTQAGSTTTPAAPITDYVVVMNLTKTQRDFVLTNARAIHCGPKLPGREMHRSKPVLRKLIPPQLYELQRQGIVSLETPREEEMVR